MVFQLSSNLLEACVLAVLEKEDTYGYVLTQSLKSRMSISESTLYPVLRRLQKLNYLETYDSSFQGRNRRYYKITKLGLEKLIECKDEWKEYKQRVDSIFGGVLEDE